MIRVAPLAIFAGPFLSQDYSTLQAERVATGLLHPDGIVWSRDGFLVVADVLKRKVYRIDFGSPPRPVPMSDVGVQGLTYDVQGRLYFCELQTRRIMRMDRKGKVENFAAEFEGRKLNSPRDVAVRKDGHAYFVDPAFASAIDTRELSFNGIFHVAPRGEIETIARWQTRPNGIALTADGKTLYVTDADRHAVVAFTLDGHGTASGQRDVVTNMEGVPGGLRVDTNGRLYVAERGLSVYSAEGKEEHRVLTGEVVSNCAFGDNDFETLYACGRKAVYRLRLGVKGALQY